MKVRDGSRTLNEVIPWCVFFGRMLPWWSDAQKPTLPDRIADVMGKIERSCPVGKPWGYVIGVNHDTGTITMSSEEKAET